MLEHITIGKTGLIPCDADDRDARGILWVWEKPSPLQNYVLGVDPTQGIPGWNRTNRSKNDYLHDNACVSVWKIGGGQPDVQVAEWAAPVDPFDLVEIVNYLGRLYGGANEDGQALCAIEVYPGPGWMVKRDLINRFGYTNQPHWLVEKGITMGATDRIGWYSNKNTRSDLWTRCVSHIERDGAIIRSPFLVEEMADCTPDSFTSVTARAKGRGSHDDRVVAALIALWFANEWSLSIEPTEPTEAQNANAPSWQASDVSATRLSELWEDHVANLLDTD